MSSSIASLGKDLLLTPRFAADEWDVLDLTTQPPAAVYRDESVDLAATDGVSTLRQALVMRLLTPRGSLRELGHASYGSRLHELVGESDSETLRARARAFVIQAIRQEQRAKLADVVVTRPTASEPDTLRIAVDVYARDLDERFGLVLGLSLDGAGSSGGTSGVTS